MSDIKNFDDFINESTLRIKDRELTTLKRLSRMD
jgi:hypothetical protein